MSPTNNFKYYIRINLQKQISQFNVDKIGYRTKKVNNRNHCTINN